MWMSRWGRLESKFRKLGCLCVLCALGGEVYYMDVDSIRHYCLSFPHTKEKLQWGETLCFKVGDKIFTLLNLDVASETRLSLKCTPERFAELIEVEGVRPAPYVGRYHWVALEQLDSLRDREIEELIGASYAMVAGKAKIIHRRDRRVRRAKKT
jgi:predicted DNA-binding protein (MmcQ/YjbR family)